MNGRWKQLVGLVTSTVVIMTVAVPAWPHHSFAMYEPEKVATVEGTVVEFQWANPHVILRVAATSPSAAENGRVWTLEFPAPSQISRNGWSHSTLKAGDKLTVKLHPFRDGRLGGSFISAILPNGEEMKR